MPLDAIHALANSWLLHTYTVKHTIYIRTCLCRGVGAVGNNCHGCLYLGFVRNWYKYLCILYVQKGQKAL